MSKVFLLPLAGAFCLLLALIEAWFLTAHRYYKWSFVRKIFKNYRDLIRSHIDYLIMGSIMFSTYAVVKQLNVEVPDIVCWMALIGSLYNPFGFILQAIAPSMTDSLGSLGKILLSIGFLPLTLGLGSILILIIQRIVELEFPRAG